MPVLQFKGKTAVESYHHTVPHHVLEFDPKLSVLGKGEKPGLDGNLIIEGDNLVALKALLPTHAGRIKCIYIDPPYNTGNEGWVYNDNLAQPQFKEWIGEVVGKEGEDATRHDKWCCMLYPRLHLLKELLHEDGILFVALPGFVWVGPTCCGRAHRSEPLISPVLRFSSNASPLEPPLSWSRRSARFPASVQAGAAAGRRRQLIA